MTRAVSNHTCVIIHGFFHRLGKTTRVSLLVLGVSSRGLFGLPDRVHVLAAMPRRFDVLTLGVGHCQTHATDTAFVGLINLTDIVGVGFGRHRDREHLHSPRDRPENYNTENGSDHVGEHPGSVQPLDDRCVRETAALAHGLKTVPTPGALKFVE